MTKLPKHGLFTRSATASTRSSSFIAHASRGVSRRRSAAIPSSSALAHPAASTSSSLNSTHTTSQSSKASSPFIGPLTLAASQSASSHQAPANTPFSESRSDALSTSSTIPSYSIPEPRWTPEVHSDNVLAIARGNDAQQRVSLHQADNTDLASAASLAIADVSLSHLSLPHTFTPSSSTSAALYSSARHLVRAQASPFFSIDRIPVHRSAHFSPIPHTRGVHIFYPNAAASHALNPVSASNLDASCSIAGLDGHAPAQRKYWQSATVPAPKTPKYVPLWNASTATASSSYAPIVDQSITDSLEQPLDSHTLLSSRSSDSALSRSSAYDVPLTLLSSTSSAINSRLDGHLNQDLAHASASLHAQAHQSPDPDLAQPTFTDQANTGTWDESHTSSSTWYSSASPSSKSRSSSSSSSSSSTRSPTPIISARPNLATSTAKQDSTGGHGSGSSTPTHDNSLSPYQIENALLGPSSLLTTAAQAARGNYDQRRSAAAAATSEPSDAASSSPLWTASLASSRHRKLHLAFEHGAYGIPKRHPWAAVRGNGKRVQAAPKPVVRSGAVGMLAAAADFLTGGASPSGPAAPKEKLGGEALVAEDGRILGLNSPIREHGRIVQDRLQSVQVGEDAYFLRSDSIGVADGVGGWASRAGADPALFSRLLMHFCAAELSKFDGLSADELAAHGGKKLREWEQLDPVEVMHVAWERCVRASRREGILGSSTALLAVLRGDELRIANLGDCVLLIIRAGELLFRSTEQQHSFNFPVQLGMMGHTAESVTIAANRTLSSDGFLQSGASDDLDDNAPNPLGTTTPASMDEARKGKPAASSLAEGDEDEEAEWDEPRRDAGRWAVKVQKGDIIIVGSDGLVDNLFDEDIVEEVLKFAPPPSSQVPIPDEEVSLEDADRIIEGEHEYRLPDDFSPQLVSEALCSRAKAVSEDSRAVSSPFQQRAMEEGLHYVGGKHDDISVVVAVVGDPSERLTRAGYSVGLHHDNAPDPFQSDAERSRTQ